MSTNRVVFVVNLLQDITILRPVVYLAANELGLETCLFVTNAFLKRDKAQLWQRELIEIANDTESTIYYFENEFQALHRLQNSSGIIIAASESHLEAHKQVHNLFRIVPSQYVKITLQHGFECVGFLQSRDQDLAHGREITFAADIICGWCNSERLTAVAHSQRHKLHITGPTSLLAVENVKQNSEINITSRLDGVGLVCENMHSPRLNVAGDFKSEFLEIFENFCVELERDGCQVALRPHPGGQYVINNDVRLPSNVILENEPIYKIDLKEFAYGISAPSSILIDMILAGIPTAVWQDKEGVMDLDNYKNITRITTLEDWLYFIHDAVERPNYYLEKQKAFLIENGILTNQQKILNNFSSLLKAGSIRHNITIKRNIQSLQVQRILFFAPGYIPTLQLSFLKPLSYDLAIGNVVIDVISEINLNAEFKGIKATELPAREWLRSRIDTFKPNVVIFCRWAGPHSGWLINYLNGINIPVVYHLDDDLLNIPKEIGREKWVSHNKPERLASVKILLENADLVYCSTYPLMQRIKEYGSKVPLQTGKIYCSSDIIEKPTVRSVKKVGYMGIGHEADLESVLPSIIKYLRRNPEVNFELFGTIPIPNELKEFGNRITLAPKIDNYQDFLNGLVQCQWDIGICPLIPIPFNFLKANTKWVEYTAAGIAVIATKGTIYDECCADGCGILASNNHEWYEALQYLTDNTQARLNMIREAQNKVLREYSPEQLRNQVLDVIFACKKREKIIFISNAYVPTLQLSFIKPLSNLVDTNKIELKFISELDFKVRCWETLGYSSPEEWIADVMSQYSPSLVIFCRYSGPHSKCLFENATKLKATTIYHIDDDLLGIPEEIGYGKYVTHNKQWRLDAVSYLLNQCDLVYCSTQKLQKHLLSNGVFRPIIVGDIYCSGQVINQAVNRNVEKIGYMGSLDHSHNLIKVVGALVRILRKYPNINFEFFGTIPCPPEFAEFSDRICLVPKVDNYNEFLMNLAERQWDIGICPLNSIHFNMMKANTKWVEYTSVGAAVVASKGTVYDDCCADQCGLLATSEDEWFEAIESLITDPQARFNQVIRAQRKLLDKYSIEQLTEQVLSVFNQAHFLAQK